MTPTFDAGLWERVVREMGTRDGREEALREFFRPGVDRVGIFRQALSLPMRSGTTAALALLARSPVEERQHLLRELVQLARAAHGPVGAVRDILAGLPRDWVLARIDPLVEEALHGEEYDDYWMMLELLERLDPARAAGVARRAAAHADAEVRELGREWLADHSAKESTSIISDV